MAKKTSNTARTTISIPRALKSRMDEVTENVNWSAVAARSFEDKLAEIISRKEIREMEEVVERLRASKRRTTTPTLRMSQSTAIAVTGLSQSCS